ncbi:MAG TPA: D-alanyl-D-alanine carboxypeptidase family protein [Blastocatellia bacterium]|nr:D-alanyl-D-alanine carboxypeptidase family protein [Blastocatellia bacterium]
MGSNSIGRNSLAFLIIFVTGVALIQTGAAMAGPKSRKPTSSKKARAAGASKMASRGPARGEPSNCGTCNLTPKGKKASRSKTAKAAPCKQPGYMDPAVKKNFNTAMRDLKRSGIKPVVTSTWRSSEHQARLHKCSRSSRCRKAHPGLYYAKPPGSSLHEAGFAVDISGVASGPRGAKRLTPRGRKIVKVMTRNGFKWRYGLADPAHFEADPQKHGYRSTRQAIKLSQSKCQIRITSGRKKTVGSSSRSSKQVSRSGRPGSKKA